MDIGALMFLLVHLAALYVASVLLRQAPCWMQYTVLWGIFTAQLLFCVGYALKASDVWWWWKVAIAAAVVEHLAVLLYLFRLYYKEHVEWSSSVSSPSS